ncbi:hypothetical protein B0T21DRAFT_417067 [Apiosordaria backusii]|uniref:Uncharacterized protein n=1 Tax=Apiosordaria backusii TaxID=314023 RepID=A0AA39ZQ54_9PEZI|nr:hypothetical protein B0T21DRAFT_417067 [Apiosordaria backusii]
MSSRAGRGHKGSGEGHSRRDSRDAHPGETAAASSSQYYPVNIKLMPPPPSTPMLPIPVLKNQQLKGHPFLALRFPPLCPAGAERSIVARNAQSVKVSLRNVRFIEATFFKAGFFQTISPETVTFETAFLDTISKTLLRASFKIFVDVNRVDAAVADARLALVYTNSYAGLCTYLTYRRRHGVFAYRNAHARVYP